MVIGKRDDRLRSKRFSLDYRKYKWKREIANDLRNLVKSSPLSLFPTIRARYTRTHISEILLFCFFIHFFFLSILKSFQSTHLRKIREVYTDVNVHTWNKKLSHLRRLRLCFCKLFAYKISPCMDRRKHMRIYTHTYLYTYILHINMNFLMEYTNISLLSFLYIYIF